MGFNNPIPVPLREETHKAYKILRSFVDGSNNGLDKVIPRNVLERAQGFAIFTVAKAGFLFSARAGSGIVIARLEDGSWSPPSAIAVGGLGFGGQVGAEVADFLIVLNSRSAVTSFMSAGSVTLGGNLSVAVGPLGRNAEGAGALNTKGKVAAMYSYSKTRGLFGGVSVEGSVIAERQDANRIAYGGNPSAKQILSGTFSPPDWAYVLIDELDRKTGIPGGHQWVNDDEEDTGAMGWSTPTSNGKHEAGYAFGEGVGAGGTSSKNRKRSSSLFSLGNKDKGESGAMFAQHTGRPRAMTSYPASSNDNGNGNGYCPSASSERTPPSRPWEQSRASSYMPNLPNLPNLGFNKANGNSDRKSGPSSDTYNAHHSPAETRPRQGSNPRRPYADRPTPSPFADIGRSRNATPNESPDSTPVLSSGDYDSNSNGTSSRDEPDLLGTWDSNDRGITANFARMNMNGRDRSGSRSRRQSTLPFEDIAEDPYRTRESTSTTYSKDWSRTDSRDSRDSYSRPRPFSVHGAPKGGFPTTPHDDTDPFRERDRDDYGYRGYDDDVRGMRDGSPQFDDFLVDRRGGRGANVDAEGYARAVALFDFNARESDDLGFKKGQVLTVLDGANDSVQWWRGRLGDDTAEGIFPANYVEVLDIPRKLRGGLTKTQLRTRLLSGQDFE